MECAAITVNIGTVRRICEHDNFCTELFKNKRCKLIRSAIGAIQNDAHTAQVDVLRKCSFSMNYVASHRVFNAFCTTKHGTGRKVIDELLRENQSFHFSFNFVGQFVAIVAKKFDAVVFIGIVRSTHHDARISAHTGGQKGHSWSRHRTHQQRLSSLAGHTGGQGLFDHIRATAGVFADQNDRLFVDPTTTTPKVVGHSATHLKGDFCRHGITVCDSSDAVCTKKFLLRHEELLT